MDNGQVASPDDATRAIFRFEQQRPGLQVSQNPTDPLSLFGRESDQCYVLSGGSDQKGFRQSYQLGFQPLRERNIQLREYLAKVGCVPQFLAEQLFSAPGQVGDFGVIEQARAVGPLAQLSGGVRGVE